MGTIGEYWLAEIEGLIQVVRIEGKTRIRIARYPERNWTRYLVYCPKHEKDYGLDSNRLIKKLCESEVQTGTQFFESTFAGEMEC